MDSESEKHISQSIPDSLKLFSNSQLLHAIELFYSAYNPKRNLNVNNPKSMFGTIVESLTKEKSTIVERRYIHSLWTQDFKENADQQPQDKKIKQPVKHRTSQQQYRLRKEALLDAEAEIVVRDIQTSKKNINVTKNIISPSVDNQPTTSKQANSRKLNTVDEDNTCSSLNGQLSDVQATSSSTNIRTAIMNAESDMIMAKFLKKRKKKSKSSSSECSTPRSKPSYFTRAKQKFRKLTQRKKKKSENNEDYSPSAPLLNETQETGQISNINSNSLQQIAKKHEQQPQYQIQSPHEEPLYPIQSPSNQPLYPILSPGLVHGSQLKRNQLNAEAVTDLEGSSNSEDENLTIPESEIIQDEELQKIIQHYDKRIDLYPTYSCPVCKRMVYNKSSTTCQYTLTEAVIDKIRGFGCNDFKAGNTIKLCSRCKVALKKSKIPTMAYFNKMEMPNIPDIIDQLTPIEARLISQVKPFLKIFHLCKGRGQLALKGSCIHFPQSVENVIESLPLTPDISDMVIIHESSLGNNNKPTSFQVRGQVVYQALDWLTKNNELYRQISIQQIPEKELQLTEIKSSVNIIDEEEILTNSRSQQLLGYKDIGSNKHILHGSFHQASLAHFPYGGQQCAAMCATAIAYSVIQPINTWTISTIDSILIEGDRFFSRITENPNSPIEVTEISGTVTCFNHVAVNIRVSLNHVFFGSHQKVIGDHDLLNQSIQEFIESDFNAGIVTQAGYCVGLIKLDQSLYLFDSHSRGKKGYTSGKGSACVIRCGIDTAAQEFKKMINRNQPVPAIFKQDQPDTHHLFQYTIRPIVCSVNEEINEEEIQNRIEPVDCIEVQVASKDDRNLEISHQTVSLLNDNSARSIHICSSRIPTSENLIQLENSAALTENSSLNHQVNLDDALDIHITNNPLLDCVIRQDEPMEPELQQFISDCRNPNIQELNLDRQRGRPLYPEKEERLEELSFIKCFPHGRNGFSENRESLRITPLDYFQQRIMGDNTAFQNNEYLFYALSRVESYVLFQKIAVMGNLAANDGADAENNDPVNLPGLQNIHLYMSGIRGSASYWKKYCGDVLSMIEQLKTPTFFMTISYDDLNSYDTLTALWKAMNGPDTQLPCDPKDIPYDERRDALNNYPVASSRHFCHRMNIIMDIMKKNATYLFGTTIHDFTYRVEFQARGSAHAHLLLWLDNVPDWNTPEGIEFIEKNISCSLDGPDKDFVLRYQNHHHSKTCFKKHNICRFGFPRKPSTVTKILDDDDIAKNFGRFLDLKRTPDEIMINNFHPKLLKIFKCNIDIQPVTGSRAIAYYIGKYIGKAEPMEVKEEIRNAIEKFKSDSSSSYYSRAMNVASTIIRHREISAPEAAFRLCHLPLRKCSRSIVFVPTYLKEQRLRMINRNTLHKDPKVGMNAIDRYSLRPTELENLSLLEFVAYYAPRRTVRTKAIDNDNVEGTDSESDSENEEREHNSRNIKLLNGKGTMYKRNRHAIVKTPFFNPIEQPDNHMYSLILLLFPFREETFLEGFSSISEAFRNLRDNFRTSEDDPIIQVELMEKIRLAMLQLLNPQEIYDEVDRGQNRQDEDEEYDLFFEENPEEMHENELFVDVHRELDINDTLEQRIRLLNTEQRIIFDKVFHHIVTGNQDPMRELILGGGGVGKSMIISTLSMLISSRYTAGERAIIRAAPTGIASRNIQGVTCHKAFSLGVETTGIAQYIKLGGRRLHERRMLFKDVKWIIIDEISMISYHVFRQIHLRLTEIRDNDFPFANFNMILFGDLLQLQPVRGTEIYRQPERLSHEIHLWRLFTFNELFTVMRQKNRDVFYDILQKLRIGTLQRSDIDILRERLVDNLVNPDRENFEANATAINESLHLFPKVRQVDAYNSLRMENLQKSGVSVYNLKAVDTFAAGSKYGQVVPDHLLPKDPRKCAGILKILEIAEGCKVILRNYWAICELHRL